MSEVMERSTDVTATTGFTDTWNDFTHSITCSYYYEPRPTKSTSNNPSNNLLTIR